MAVSLETPCFALIDGALCKLNRRGGVLKRHTPLGSAVVEFRLHGDQLFVREEARGFLLGMPNLYCLDLNLFISWLAELPGPGDPFEAIEESDSLSLLCRTVGGITCRISTTDGKVLEPALV